MQTMYAVVSGKVRELSMPPPDAYVLRDIVWGAFDELLTPAYWRGQAWQHNLLGTYDGLRLGRTLQEEVAACLLGGYGMPAELALAAYRRLRDAGLLEHTPSAAEIEQQLEAPFVLAGKERRYRFARQKAAYLSACLSRLVDFEVPADDFDFRRRLAELPGVGLKTASWIVRNLRPQSDVAVLDVHILRAGRLMGLFDEEWEPQRHYLDLEGAFISFARAIDVSPASLDGLMWDYMRRLSPVLLKRKGVPESSQADLFEHIRS